MKSLFNWRLSILDRYITTHFLGSFIMAIGGFVIVGIVDFLFSYVDLFVNAKVPFWVVSQLLLYKIPAIMVLFFPMAVLFSTMLLLIKMAKENELTICRSSGIHLLRIAAPLIYLAIGISFFSFFINEKVVPWTNRVSDTLIRKSIQKRIPPTIHHNVFFKDTHDRFFYIKKIDETSTVMHQLLIFEKTAGFPQIITAERATWETQTWSLHNGYSHAFNTNGTLQYSTQFDQSTLHVSHPISDFYIQKKTPQEMDSTELQSKITLLQKGGINTRHLKIEYHLKKTIPATCFIFGIIGIMYSFLFVKTNRDWWGVVISIIAAVLSVGFYLFIVALFRSLSKKGVILPFWGAYLPILMYGVPSIGVVFYDTYRR